MNLKKKNKFNSWSIIVYISRTINLIFFSSISFITGPIRSLYHSHDACPIQSTMSIFEIHFSFVVTQFFDILLFVYELLRASLQKGQRYKNSSRSNNKFLCSWTPTKTKTEVIRNEQQQQSRCVANFKWKEGQLKP